MTLQHLAVCQKSFGLMLVEKGVSAQSEKLFPSAAGPQWLSDGLPCRLLGMP